MSSLKTITSDEPTLVRNIQALRGVAVLGVLWAHLRYAVGPLNPEAATWGFVQTAYGSIGVDIFFVISGYVICLTACKRHHRPLDFFLARVARVSPLYLAMILPGYFLLADNYPSWQEVPFSAIWTQLFYLPLFDTDRFTPLPLGVGWTLSFEMWFYIVFALLLNFWKPTRVSLILPIVFLVGAIPMTFYHGGWYFPRFMFHPFVLEFALGCVVFHTQKWVGPRTGWGLAIAGLLFLLAFSRHAGRLGWHGQLLNARMDLAWLRVLLWGVPSALVAAGLVGLERHRGYVLPGALVGLGTISYSLYLSHSFAIALLWHAGEWVHLRNAVVILLLEPTLSIALAWVCWRWIEKPLTARAQAWARATTRPVASPRDTTESLPSTTTVP